MKKHLLLLAVILVAFVSNAQYVVKDHNGVEITNGMVREFGTYGVPDGSLEYYVTNETSNEIYMRIEFVSAVEADGTGFELCFGQCYVDLTIGQTVPIAPNYVTIPANATTGEGNHFANTLQGNGSTVQDWNFKFYQTDIDGNDIGNNLNFTYRYNPLLGTEDFNKLDVVVSSTVILNEMTVKTVEELNMVVYNLQGKIVKSQQLSIGQQTVDMSGLSSQMYIVNFNNNEGASKTVKIVVK